MAICSLIFQLFAEATDVNQLLEMIRATVLQDKITLDGETQNLQLMNPAGFFLKYHMPTMPSAVGSAETASLTKGYYKGVVFDIPGAEVNLGGTWTPVTAANRDAIMAKNPFTLQWRINGTLLRKYGYKTGDTVKGTVIAVDDQWHGLNLSKEISFQVK
ncbi:MAG: hypothetical protein IK092_04790 [Muribaculaceae bacterium]|nr:hypothetical protein [Muribaculaceae bacterium]